MPSALDECCCGSCGDSHLACDEFHGLVQHSFALHLPTPHAPFHGRTNLDRLLERFKCEGYTVQPVGDLAPATDVRRVNHSPLAQSKLTTLEHCLPQFLEPRSCGAPLRPPLALSWAEPTSSLPIEPYEEPNLIFADWFDGGPWPSINDFLVRADTTEALESEEQWITQLLLELLAHKRSRLFGFALANRVVTMMLPGTTLEPIPAGLPSRTSAPGAWFMQPLISLIRSGTRSRRFRNMYALTLLLLPVEPRNRSLRPRLMTPAEIKAIVNPGWGFAAAPPADREAHFNLPEPLLDYLSTVAKLDVKNMAATRCSGPTGATLRQITERVAFGVGLTLAQGKGHLSQKAKRLIGNNVIMALGSARVSSVVVVDNCLKSRKIEKPVRKEPFPGALLSLMETLAKPARTPEVRDRHARKYRLDRPFVDGNIYAVGVLPTKRCLVVVSRRDAQYGVRESALMQAGSVAHMTIGAATAIGTMREIDRRLELLEDAKDPKKIAEIDAEIASDLAEIYDLDITRESYRAIYQRLRDRLGISRDYKTLQGKMESLYRATSTFRSEDVV